MNTYMKYCPNVYVASCDVEHSKGDEIELTTKRGKINLHIKQALSLVPDSHVMRQTLAVESAYTGDRRLLR